MFEFEPDEYLFTKLAYYFKRKKKEKQARLAHRADLNQLKARLTLIASAVTGYSIELFEAEEEGGYKDDNFFLPKEYCEFETLEENIDYYIFRVLYLSVQKNLHLNWQVEGKTELKASRIAAEQNSKKVLKELFADFPSTEKIYDKLLNLYKSKSKDVDKAVFHYIYGKYMLNSSIEELEKKRNNKVDKIRSKEEDSVETILKSGAVEEIVSVEVDQKQMEDATTMHQFEKVETAEEFGGNWRDMDGDDELEDHENALEDIKMKFTVRVDDSAHSVYQADFIENTTVSESADIDQNGFHISYDEWDYSKRTYKPKFCKVYPKTILKTDTKYYTDTLKEHQSTLINLKKLLSTVNNKYLMQRRKAQGEEFDLDAVIDLYTDIHSGHTPSENIYLSKRKKEKDLSILLLLDMSLSSDGYAGGNRVIDVEKQVSILFGELLNDFGIDFSINSFYSKTRNHSTYVSMKGFDDHWDKAKHRIGAIQPSGYTRIGAALRHSGALLDKRDTTNKWVILLSDGKPNDYDKYEGAYGVKDVKQALTELNERGINSYALAIEAEAKFYLPQMFGKGHYQILTTPFELLKALVKVFEKIKHKS
jgi:nitric oxide reductase NorD protein